MDTTFINFENSKTSGPHRLLFNLSNKINLKRNMLLYQILAILNMEKYKKSHIKIINLECQLQGGMEI